MFKHYTVTDNVFNKIIFYNEKISSDSVELEAELQQISNKYGFSPKVLDIIYENDKATINMEYINEKCLYYKYGKHEEDIPNFIWEQIRDKLKILYEEEGIQYTDITPYNFIEKNGEVYIIDFGHADYTYEGEGDEEDDEIDEFLKDFLEGANEWNYDYYDYYA